MSEKPRKHFVILGFDKEEQAERYFKRTSYGRIDGCNMASLNIKHTEIGQRLEEENKKLQEDKAKLVECLKFYANKENWIYSKESHIGGLIVVKDTWKDQPNAGAACFYPEYGGKLAIQTLKDIGEEV